MFVEYNPNPHNKNVGDCVIRAVSKALNQSWERSYSDLCSIGQRMKDMPNANHVWGSYLKQHGFRRNVIPDTCPDCYTVRDFCADHPVGTYVLSTGDHVIAVRNGNHFDTWDSSDEVPQFYWRRI